jgi:methionyl-tRNA formyltransferase
MVLMGTGPFAVPSFQRLMESDDEVLLVVTRPVPPSVGKAKQPINPVFDLAMEYDLPTEAPQDINAAESVRRLEALRPDLLVVCDYGQILSNQALATAKLGGINLHGSLLPRYRGAAPIQWAILAGDRRTGVSVIHMTPKLDGGPILAERVAEIGVHETSGELEQRLCELGVHAVVDAIEQLRFWNGVAPLGQPQDPHLVTKAPRFKKADGELDWRRDADYLSRQIRALQPWPGSFSEIETSDPKKMIRLIVRRATAMKLGEKPSVPPGMIVQTEPDLWVACGQGYLQLEVVQPSGKREMGADEFLRGHRLLPGQRFSQLSSARVAEVPQGPVITRPEPKT